MKNDLVFLLILCIVVAYTFIIYKVEKMTDVSNYEQIADAVKQYYLSDEFVKNISTVAAQIQKDGLTLSGNLTSANINANGNINVSNATNEGGRLSILNALKNGKAGQTNNWALWNMTGAYGNKLSFWRYNGDGVNAGPALDLNDNGTVNIPGDLTTANINSNGNLDVKGKLNMSDALLLGSQNIIHPDVGDGAFYRADGQVQIASDDLIRLRHIGSKSTGIQFDIREGAGDIQIPNGQMKISRQGIMFGGTNNNREVNSGQISAGLHIPNSLNIVGMSADTGHTSRRVDMWSEGGFNVYGPTNMNGNLTVGGTIFEKRNKARYIRVGNSIDTSISKNEWTLIEVRAYDNAGNNVALGKPVTVLAGSRHPNTNGPPSNITDGRIFNAPNTVHDNTSLGYHGNTGPNVLQIDLGSEFDLSNILLFNRYNGDIDQRMDGTTIELFGADGDRNRIIYTGLWHRQYSKEYTL